MAADSTHDLLEKAKPRINKAAGTALVVGLAAWAPRLCWPLWLGLARFSAAC